MYECHFCRASGGYTIRAPGCELGSGATFCEDYPGPRSGMGVGRCKRRPSPARGGGGGRWWGRGQVLPGFPPAVNFSSQSAEVGPDSPATFAAHLALPSGTTRLKGKTQRPWGQPHARVAGAGTELSVTGREQLRPEAGRSGPQEANARRFPPGGLGVNKPHT